MKHYILLPVIALFLSTMACESFQEGDFDYVYELSLNEHDYPNTIYEKLGSAYTRFIS